MSLSFFRNFGMFLSLLLFLVPVCASGEVPVSSTIAQYVDMDVAQNAEGFTYIIQNEEVSIARYSGNNIHLIIPEQMDGYPVTAIGKNAFSACTGLNSITIPESITRIDEHAFAGCSGLSCIYAEEASYAGSWCIANGYEDLLPFTLKIIQQPMDVCADNEKEIAVFVATVGNDIEYQWYYADRNEEIYTKANHSTNTYSVKMDTTVDGRRIYCVVTNSYGKQVKSKEVVLSLSVPEELAYRVDDETVTITGYKGSAEELLIPSRIEGKPVTAIDSNAFRKCSSLTSITIPEGVITIEEETFSGCENLDSIIVYPDNPVYASVDGVLFNREKNILIQYPCKRAVYRYTIPQGTQRIGNEAFSGCIRLTSISIPDSITSIGNNAFYGCTGLVKITIPQGVTSIGRNAFNGCSRLVSIAIPEGVTSIENGTFSYCSGLKSIVLPDNVISIGDYAFGSCISLAEVEFPFGVTSIGAHAFSQCSRLSEMTIPDSVAFIGEGAFSGCVRMNKIILPQNIVSIGNSVFRDCSGLKGIELPDSITSIGNYAFSGCTSLTSVLIPDGVIFMGDYVFSGCTRLAAVTLPEHLSTIRPYTFSGCTDLKDISFLDGVINIGEGAFSGCTGLRSITFPQSVTHIDSLAFSYCTNLRSVTAHKGIVHIGYDAFIGCTSLTRFKTPYSCYTYFWLLRNEYLDF